MLPCPVRLVIWLSCAMSFQSTEIRNRESIIKLDHLYTDFKGKVDTSKRNKIS